CKGGFGMGEEESELVKALKGFKEMISQKYDIREMILFGSQMSVEADGNSDIDLIVVGEEIEEKRKEISIVRQAIKEGIII
ncbi:putative nucleotidyltransferase, partial [Methanophagales archaeon]